MQSPVPALVVLACLLFASRAGAPPPVSPFPAEVRPASGSAPTNAWIWGFGRDAPALSEIGVSVLADGSLVTGVVEPLGEAGVVFKPASPFDDQAQIDVVVSGPVSDVEGSFAAEGPSDTTPPTLASATLLDDGVPLVIGLEGADDRLLAGFVARADSEVRGAAPPGFVVLAEADSEGCVTVVAVDVAGNESAPLEVCRPSEPEPDAGPEPDVEPEPDPPGSCACSGGSLALVAPCALTLGLRRRGRALRHPST